MITHNKMADTLWNQCNGWQCNPRALQGSQHLAGNGANGVAHNLLLPGDDLQGHQDLQNLQEQQDHLDLENKEDELKDEVKVFLKICIFKYMKTGSIKSKL